MLFVSVEFRKANIDTNPATTLLTPKSTTPNVLNTTRDVYKETMRINNILTYRNAVFLAILLLFEMLSDIDDLFASFDYRPTSTFLCGKTDIKLYS